MRLTTVILIATLMQVSASGFAQRITLNQQKASLEQVLKSIRDQSGYDMIFDRKLVLKARPVSIQVKEVTINEALEQVLSSQTLSFEIADKTITIKEKTPSFLPIIPNDRRNLFIDAVGKIVDESGKPLEGATVVLKGTNRTAKTDAKGEFVLANMPDDGVLVIRYVGYKQLEISLKDAVMPLEIKLNVATGELEEVKVVYNTGYQELIKERAAGSFTQVDNELFNRRVSANVLDRIDDLVPGLLKLRSGTSNPLLGLRIRGLSTINASQFPLLVVDNFIYDGDPNTLNPNDVESVTILKDATAASIWGVRAGNGVIVITTKRGKVNQKPNVSIVSNATIVEKPDLYSMPAVPSKDVIALERTRFTKGYYNASLNNTTAYPVLALSVEIMDKAKKGTITHAEANAQLDYLSNYDIRDDIYKYLLQSNISQQYALNISGGTNIHQYFGSLGYNRNRPNDVNISKERLSMRFSNAWTPIAKLSLRAEINWTKILNNNQNSLTGGAFSLLNSPYLPLADEQGNALSIPFGYRENYKENVQFPGKLDWRFVPLEEINNGNSKSSSNDLRVVGGINYKIIFGLNADVSYQWQNSLSEKKDIDGLDTWKVRNLINQYVSVGTNGLPVYPYPLGAIYSQNNSNQRAWNFRAQLNLNRTLGRHNLTAVAGYESRQATIEALLIPFQYGYNEQTNTFQTVLFGQWPVRPQGSITTISSPTPSLTGTLNRFNSLFANAGYIFNRRYILNTSARIDQSNFFGVKANDRKVPLWSIGGAWNISDESFYKVSWMPDLKLRATYGYSGNVNAGTSPFSTIRYNNPIATAPVSVPYATIATPPNPQLRWERVQQVNLALDFGFANNRIRGSIDFYQKRGLDLISDITLAPSAGLVTYTGNQSSIKNRGIDLSLNSNYQIEKFQWNTALIVSYNVERVTTYTVDPPIGAVQPVSYNSLPMIGKPLSKLYSYNWAGLNPTSGDAQLYIKGQVMGSLASTTARLEDYIYHGRSDPSYSGALRNDFRWQHISLSVSLSYQLGYYFRRASFQGHLGGSTASISSWQHEDYLQVWTKPGDELITQVPGFLDSYPDNRYGVYGQSDILIEKGDHIRVQDIRLSYDLNRQFIKRLPARKISLYVYANNVGFVWKASKYNPDTGNSLQSPLQKSIAFGLDVNF